VSLDLAEQGENVLWGSSLPVSTDKNAREKFEALADRFENLSLYFMKFHGGSDVDEVLDAMEYAVYVNDVEHIILVSL
jgi:twinkle protein